MPAVTSETTPGAPTGPRPVAEHSLPRISAQSLLGPEGVSGTAHFHDLLRSATRQCRKLVDCEQVRLWVARRGGRRLVARDFPDENPGTQPQEHRLPRGEGFAGWVMTHQRTLRLGAGDELPDDVKGARTPFRSALVIPLLRRGEPFGAIECLDKRGGDFTDADFDRLEVAAESVAFALDYALLYQEIERRALEKEVLLDITRALASPFDLEEVIEEIFKSLRQVVDYDAAAIYLVQRGILLLFIFSALLYVLRRWQFYDMLYFSLSLLVAGHILKALADPVALHAMRTGLVPTRWARAAHPRWHDEVVGPTAPDPAPDPAPDAASPAEPSDPAGGVGVPSPYDGPRSDQP